MPFSAYAVKLVALAETLHRWLSVLTGLDRANRERIADYAEAIAATLSRAAEALERAGADPRDRRAQAVAERELGRISGYVETIVAVLEPHLDGRKLAGVKRRLETLGVERLTHSLARGAAAAAGEIAGLASAEGYFRALADGLRT